MGSDQGPPVQESCDVSPDEEDDDREHKDVGQKREERVSWLLQKKPHQGGSAQDDSRQVSVLPQESIGSCMISCAGFGSDIRRIKQ